jgi:hypothetical protein
VFFFLATLCSLAGCGEGDGAGWQGEPTLSNVQAELSSAYVGCYIDTPAYDVYTVDRCRASGSTPTVAVFQLITPTPALFVRWYDHPECTYDVCAVPIAPGESVMLHAGYYVPADNPQTVRYGGLATATYHSNN